MNSLKINKSVTPVTVVTLVTLVTSVTHQKERKVTEGNRGVVTVNVAQPCGLDGKGNRVTVVTAKCTFFASLGNQAKITPGYRAQRPASNPAPLGGNGDRSRLILSD